MSAEVGPGFIDDRLVMPGAEVMAEDATPGNDGEAKVYELVR